MSEISIGYQLPTTQLKLGGKQAHRATQISAVVWTTRHTFTTGSSFAKKCSLERSDEQVDEQNDSAEKKQRLPDRNDPPAWNALELTVRIIDTTTIGCMQNQNRHHRVKVQLKFTYIAECSKLNRQKGR